MSTTADTRPPSAPPTPPLPPPPPPPRRSLVGVTVGLVFIALGVVTLLIALGVDLSLAAVGPALLVLLGLGVVASAVRGEPSDGLLGFAVFVGILLALAALAGSVLDVPLRGGIGERQHRPERAAEMPSEYQLLIGSLQVDLRDLHLPAGTTEISLSTAIGEVELQLPADVEVAVDTDVGGGSATVLGVTNEGLSVDNDQQTDGYTGADRRLRIHVGVGLGEVRVTR